MKPGFYWVIDHHHVHPDAGYPEVAQLRGDLFFFTTGDRAVTNDPRWVTVLGDPLPEPEY